MSVHQSYTSYMYINRRSLSSVTPHQQTTSTAKNNNIFIYWTSRVRVHNLAAIWPTTTTPRIVRHRKWFNAQIFYLHTIHIFYITYMIFIYTWINWPAAPIRIVYPPNYRRYENAALPARLILKFIRQSIIEGAALRRARALSAPRFGVQTGFKCAAFYSWSVQTQNEPL